MATRQDKSEDQLPSETVLLKHGTAIWPKLNTPDRYKDKETGKVNPPQWSVRLNYYKPADGDDEQTAKQKAERFAAAMIVFEKLEKLYEESCAKHEQDYADEIEAKIAAWQTKKKGTKPQAKELKRLPKGWKEIEDENGVGISFNVKMNAEFEVEENGVRVTKKQAPPIFDAKKQKYDRDAKPGMKGALPQIGNGTLMNVAAQANFFVTGETNIGVTLKLKSVQLIAVKTYTGKTADDYGFGEEEGEDMNAKPDEDDSDEAGEEVDLSDA